MGRNLFPNESLKASTSEPVAPMRIGRNLFPNDFPAEEESFLDKLPRNILIGLTNAGKGLHNLPHDLIQSLETATQGFGNQFDMLKTPKAANRKNISEYLPDRS